MKVPRELRYGSSEQNFFFTDRRSLAASPGSAKAGYGSAKAGYGSANLAFGVGDDPVAVAVNRSQLARQIELSPARLIFMNQVHGTTVAYVTEPRVDSLPETDAMVTNITGLGLAVLVADCVPVIARDQRAGVIGVAHAGRLGAAAGIVPALIAAMMDLGARPADLELAIGPAICGRCYEVPESMRDEVDAQLPGSACVTADGTAGLDLRAGVAGQLQVLGVGRVRVDERCTKEDPNLFSHRGSAPTGRFAGVVRL